jgi:hypothetical protein
LLSGAQIGGDPSDPALAGLIAALAPSNFPPEVIMPSKQQQQQQQQRQGTGGGRCDLLQTATPLEVGQAPPASAAAPGSEEGGSSSGGRGLRGSKGGSKGSGKPDYVAQLESGSGSIRPGALLTFERQLGGCLTARVGQQVRGCCAGRGWSGAGLGAWRAGRGVAGWHQGPSLSDGDRQSVGRTAIDRT